MGPPLDHFAVLPSCGFCEIVLKNNPAAQSSIREAAGLPGKGAQDSEPEEHQVPSGESAYSQTLTFEGNALVGPGDQRPVGVE